MIATSVSFLFISVAVTTLFRLEYVVPSFAFTYYKFFYQLSLIENVRKQSEIRYNRKCKTKNQ